MNPIHEAGFASLFVLFIATGPSALAALVALVLSRFRPKAAAIAAGISVVLAALVCVLAAITTSKLHERIDYWINTGGYGPPADVMAQYGPEWHASARLTAMVGMLFTSVPFAVSALAYRITRRDEPWSPAARGIGIFAAIAAFWCLLICVL
jgi:hypothetical protein